jgi:hypothetical protein
MRADLSFSGLACIIALMFLTAGPAKAQPNALALDQSSAGGLEQVYYRYRRGYGHRRYGYGYGYGYRPYGYYGRPYGYGYRPYYSYGYGYPYYRRPGIGLWFGF